MLRNVRYAWLLIALAGCQTQNASNPKMAEPLFSADLGLTASEVVYEYPARFATAAIGSQHGDFQFGMYAQTRTAVQLYSYSPAEKQFHLVKVLALTSIDSAAVGEFGATRSAKQLQLLSTGTVTAVILYNNSTAMTGTSETTQPAYDALMAAHVRPGQAIDRIVPSETKPEVLFVPTH